MLMHLSNRHREDTKERESVILRRGEGTVWRSWFGSYAGPLWHCRYATALPGRDDSETHLVALSRFPVLSLELLPDTPGPLHRAGDNSWQN